MYNEKIIIDTDPGDDIDDAFAIAFAANAGMNIIGVTTVFRNAMQRAKMTKLLLKYCGRGDIPVYAGVDTAIVQKMQYLLPPEMLEKEMKEGYYTLPQYMPEMENEVVEDEHAVDFIIRKARELKGELVLVAIGPFSNVAMAVRKAPDIIPLIKELRIIAGYYTKDIPEWNIACDPEAARVMYTCGIPIKAIGLDLTLQCPLSDEDQVELRNLSQEGNKLIIKMMDKWFEHYKSERPIMHDPIVIASMLDDSVVGFEEKYVLIGLQGQERNKTIMQDEPTLENSKIKVGLTVNRDRFFEIFKKYIFKHVN